MLEKLILYFVCKSKGFITKTQLTKFLYLADLYAVKWTGNPLTDLDWRYYLYGPWNEETDQVLKELYDRGILGEYKKDQSTFIKPMENCPNLEDLGLSQGLELMLRNIRKEWIGAGKLDQLLEYVYQTEPMLEAQKNHQREEKASLNLQLEREKLVIELGV
ncbi:MAG: SocA family protein [Pseudanabaena sp. CAN_BIN31]|jgi:uncharacterized phage-associated protein|nr:SocA family protein [Pseudanabaena sp. CAN_BIN31]